MSGNLWEKHSPACQESPVECICTVNNRAEPVQFTEKDHYPQINHPGITALTVNGEIWEPRGKSGGFYQTAYNDLRRTQLQLLIWGGLGWALMSSRWIWGF